jgi:hypothetical protein
MKTILPTILALVAFSIPVCSQTTAVTPPSDQKQGLTSDGGQWGFKHVAGTDASLPKVLLIGDSICIGYRQEAGRQLQSKAYVDCFVTPMHIGTPKPLEEQLTLALAHGPYAVIHFNDMGLHSWQKGRIAEGKYESLLRDYVAFLRTSSPGSALIWVSTTPMTVKGQPTQLAPDNATIVERNAIAARVMQELNIPTDDLYQLVIEQLSLGRGDGFHWTPAGQILQGDQVAAMVEKALAAPPSPAVSK